MNLLTLLATTVLAAEGIISPLPQDTPAPLAPSEKPLMSFGQLPAPSVLGASFDEPTPTPKATNNTKKPSYTIAVLGDSMVDTLGPGVPNLKNGLEKIYPKTEFTVLNYGVGGTNIDYGLERVTSTYTYLGNTIPALVTQHPDIVVIESFGYNPYIFDEGAIDKHWLQLAAIIDTTRRYLPAVKIVIAATIAPDPATFGDGGAMLSFSLEDKRKRTGVIKKYLESTVKFAQSQKLPLADAYHASLDSQGNGKAEFINGGDHIHPSEIGKELFAKKVIEAIDSNNLLQ